jgi:hypothetical protein
LGSAQALVDRAAARANHSPTTTATAESIAVTRVRPPVALAQGSRWLLFIYHPDHRVGLMSM